MAENGRAWQRMAENGREWQKVVGEGDIDHNHDVRLPRRGGFNELTTALPQRQAPSLWQILQPLKDPNE